MRACVGGRGRARGSGDTKTKREREGVCAFSFFFFACCGREGSREAVGVVTGRLPAPPSCLLKWRVCKTKQKKVKGRGRVRPYKKKRMG